MKNIEFNDLVTFIRDMTADYDTPITLETLVENDLGVSGLGAENFIVAFGEQYNVDISHFKFSKYFYSEPHIFSFLSRKKTTPFKVAFLVKAIVAGRLDEQVINSDTTTKLG
jgi:acyl carrier protein